MGYNGSLVYFEWVPLPTEIIIIIPVYYAIIISKPKEGQIITMDAPYFQKLFAERIGGVHYGTSTEIYKFEKIKRAKRKALAEFPDRHLLDFGIGENDEMADPAIRKIMGEEINKLENRGYADNGCIEYKEAVARFMKRRFNVDLNPTTEINHCMGTKTALAMLPEAFINPGDVTLMTVPGYPVAGTHTKYCV